MHVHLLSQSINQDLFQIFCRTVIPKQIYDFSDDHSTEKHGLNKINGNYLLFDSSENQKIKVTVQQVQRFFEKEDQRKHGYRQRAH